MRNDPMEEMRQQWWWIVMDIGIAFMVVCAEGAAFMLLMYLIVEAVR